MISEQEILYRMYDSPHAACMPALMHAHADDGHPSSWMQGCRRYSGILSSKIDDEKKRAKQVWDIVVFGINNRMLDVLITD